MPPRYGIVTFGCATAALSRSGAPGRTQDNSIQFKATDSHDGELIVPGGLRGKSHPKRVRFCVPEGCGSECCRIERNSSTRTGSTVSRGGLPEVRVLRPKGPQAERLRLRGGQEPFLPSRGGGPSVAERRAELPPPEPEAGPAPGGPDHEGQFTGTGENSRPRGPDAAEVRGGLPAVETHAVKGAEETGGRSLIGVLRDAGRLSPEGGGYQERPRADLKSIDLGGPPERT